MNTEQKNLRSSAVYEEKSIDESSLSFSDEMSNEIEDKTCFYVIAGVSAAAVAVAVVVGIVISCCCCCGEKAPEVPVSKTKPHGEEEAAAKAKAKAEATHDPYVEFGKKFNLDAELTEVLKSIKLEWSVEALNNVDYAVRVVNARAQHAEKSIDDKKFRSIHTEYKKFVLGLRQEALNEWKKAGPKPDKQLDANLHTLKDRYSTWGYAYTKYSQNWTKNCPPADLNDKGNKFTIPNKPSLDEKTLGAQGGVSLWYPPHTNGAQSAPGHLSEFLLRDGDDKQALMIVEVKHTYKGQTGTPAPVSEDLPESADLKWDKLNPKKVTNEEVIVALKKEIGADAIGGGVDRKIKGTECIEKRPGTEEKINAFEDWKQEFVQAWSLCEGAEEQYLKFGTGTAADDRCFAADHSGEGLGKEAEIIGWHGAALEYLNQIANSNFKKPEKKSAWEAETGRFTVVEGGDGIVDFKKKMRDVNNKEFQTTDFPTYMFQKEVLGKLGFYMTSDVKKAMQYATPYSTVKSAPGPNMWMQRLAKNDKKDLPRIGGETPAEHTAPRQFLLVMKGKLINFATLLSGNQELQMNRIPINTWAVACADAAKL